MSAHRSSSPVLTEHEWDLLLGTLDLARDGRSVELRSRLDAGVPVNLTSSRGDSLLMLASYHGRSETVEMLLERGADTARVNDNGQTALGAAVFRQSRQDVLALLRAGADPGAGERSAVSVATFFHLTAMLELLEHAHDDTTGARHDHA